LKLTPQAKIDHKELVLLLLNALSDCT